MEKLEIKVSAPEIDKFRGAMDKYNYFVEPVTTYRLKDFYTDKD